MFITIFVIALSSASNEQCDLLVIKQTCQTSVDNPQVFINWIDKQVGVVDISLCENSGYYQKGYLILCVACIVELN